MDSSPVGTRLETKLMIKKDKIKDLQWQPRRWYHRRDTRFVLVIIILVAVFYSWSYITGPSRLSIDLSNLIEEQEYYF